jgi:carboxypeptidase Taq
MTKFSLGDVRITTRAREDDFSEAFYSTLHETGHALYEQNIDPAFEATPLADGASSGVHEAQSRLWENMVGRSRPFCKYLLPLLQARFPSQFSDVSVDELYAAVNRVSRSLIRTDADEVTYNLHVAIRFELECALLEGSLAVADLPAAWREAYRESLGVTPPDDRDGVMQDVHWFGGTVGGAFQGYTLGNILAAQLFERARAQNPELDAQIERGEFAPLLNWLRENVYQHGSKFSPPDLIQRATGAPLGLEPYKKYLQEKFGALYRIGAS